jgi:uncharacterized protein (TIGR00251 family)
MVTKLSLRITPNARANQLLAISENVVRLKIHAPAQDGKANAELIRFLGELLDCRKSQITIVSGATARDKIVELRNTEPNAVWQKLQQALDHR